MLCSHSPLRRFEREPHSRTDPKRDALARLNKLTGLAGSGYYLIDAGNRGFSSLSLFETSDRSKESAKLVTTWIRDEKLEIVAHSDRVPVAA